ncbi:MAG: hypothetical protein FWF49_00730, partial [Oscillospiraceae bacterium]|nr:hypothetical protein [Oscillospiraceae bacterium]
RPDPMNAYTLPETGLGQTITVTLAHQGGSDSSWLILSQGDTELYRQELVDNDHDYINNANFYQGGVQWQLRNGEGTSDITFTNPRVATTFELPTQATLATQAPTTAATTASTAPTAVTTTTNHTTTDNNGGMQWWVWLIVGGGVVIVAAVVVVIVVMSKKKKK